MLYCNELLIELLCCVGTVGLCLAGLDPLWWVFSFSEVHL